MNASGRKIPEYIIHQEGVNVKMLISAEVFIDTFYTKMVDVRFFASCTCLQISIYHHVVYYSCSILDLNFKLDQLIH